MFARVRKPLLLAAIPLAVLAIFSGLGMVVTRSDTTRASPSGTVYLVPMCKRMSAAARMLSAFLLEKRELRVEILPEIEVPVLLVDPGRNQLGSNKMLNLLEERYATQLAVPKSTVIALTCANLFIEDSGNAWTFSFRHERGLAVISDARMFDAPLSPADKTPLNELRDIRLRKMVQRAIAFLHLGAMPDNNPYSLLYGNIQGVEDFDRITERVDPT
jgi:hypothetical protein